MTKTDKQKCLGYYTQAFEKANQKLLHSQQEVYKTSRGVSLLFETYHRNPESWVIIINARKGLSETIYWKVVDDFNDSISFIKEMESKR